MARNITFAPGEFYHLYNRGTEKRNIFTNKQDYERFLCLLYLCNGEVAANINRQGRTFTDLLEPDQGKKLVEITAYCLMSNHFHLLVREIQDGGISRFMQKITTGYTMYFNKKYERSGALFQGRFKATHASEDRYLKYLISYIHLNPVKLIEPGWKESGIANRKQAEMYLEKYRYSSYLDYLETTRVENKIINKEAFPEYFESPKDFKSSVTEWLSYNVM